MIEVFKCVKEINKGNMDQVLEIIYSSPDRIRGIGYKLEKKLRFRTDLGRYWFTNRVMND